MDKLSVAKQVSVARLYLSGLSHDQIAAKTGVSKGSVANVVAEVRAGRFPEAASLPEQVEALRDLPVDLGRSKLTPSHAAAGVTVLSRLHSLGVEPGEIERWSVMCRQLAMHIAPRDAEARPCHSSADRRGAFRGPPLVLYRGFRPLALQGLDVEAHRPTALPYPLLCCAGGTGPVGRVIHPWQSTG